MVEEWKDVNEEGFDGCYQVSLFGRVRAVPRKFIKKDGKQYTCNGGIRKMVLDKDGYYRISISNNGLTKHVYVHRLVAKAFIPNLDNKPCVNHIDHNPANNNIRNLEWCTYKENEEHKIKHNRGACWCGEKSNTAKLTWEKVRKIRNMYTKGGCSHRSLGAMFGVGHATIGGILRGTNWKE